eukprot:3368960-Karenia_brevis.AAC.1
MALATTVDYMDNNANKHEKMGHPPPASMTLSEVPRNITPMIFWSGAQYYLNNLGLGAKIAVVDHEDHNP